VSRNPRYTKPCAPTADNLESPDERRSKSSRKRVALAAQALGERLIALNDPDLNRLSLPETLLDAVREARRIKARGGLSRQKQYIGKLVRDLDTAAIEDVLEKLH